MDMKILARVNAAKVLIILLLEVWQAFNIASYDISSCETRMWFCCVQTYRFVVPISGRL